MFVSFFAVGQWSLRMEFIHAFCLSFRASLHLVHSGQMLLFMQHLSCCNVLKLANILGTPSSLRIQVETFPTRAPSHRSTGTGLSHHPTSVLPMQGIRIISPDLPLRNEKKAPSL
jgi:hypothetical protein